MLEIRHLKKYYGDLCVYEDFSLSAEDGKTLAVLGASGAGKTTLLNIAAGLLPFDGGEIFGRPERVSYVFQSDRLVRHMTVLENLRLVADEARAKEYLVRAKLSEFADQYPARLSAGMSRRVAILRAFLYDAPLVLMDEPFKGLDEALSHRIIERIREKQMKEERIILFTSHNPDEIRLLADEVIYL